MFTFTKANAECIQALDGWKEYVKVTPTKMTRVSGSFKCETKEGLVECDDGFLAIDAEGFPYPVAKSIHDKTYKLVPKVNYRS